ncbi:MAG: PAS domain-containing protein [Sedimentisphaerales bacterium]|nr:PAS domain-containing protein [Sedimentisphaerales bacterium]
MIAEQANDGIVVVDSDGCLRFVNEAWVVMHGYKTKDDLISRQISLFLAKEQMNTDMIALLEEAKRCGQSEGTVEHIKSDGTVFPVQTKIVLIRDEAGKATGLIVFAADTSQRTELQETTVENLKRVKHLSDQIIRLRKLLGECLEIGEYLAEQTGELQANNEILRQQMTKLDQSLRKPEQHPAQILHRKAQVTTTNQLLEDMNPEHRQSEETSAESPELMVKSEKSRKLLYNKELGEAAELARCLSGSPNRNLQSEHEDNPEELERRINQAISVEWMQAVQKYACQHR